MFEFLTLGFMQRAILIGEIIAVISGLVGPILIFRKMSFMGVGISHGTFAGIALGILLGVSPLWMSIVFAIGLGLFIGFVSRTGKVSEDATIGTLFAFAMALGIFLIDLSPGYHTNIMGYLFGDLLAISNGDMYLAVTVLILTVVWYMLRGRAARYTTFDEDFSRIMGIPVEIDYYIFMAIVSLVIVAAVRFVGVILASSILVGPAAASKMLSKKFSLLVTLSISFGGISVFSGIALSYGLNVPSGPAVVFFVTGIFLVTLTINWIKRTL